MARIDRRVPTTTLHVPTIGVIAATRALLGIDHKKLTFRFQGRDYRLTDVHGNVVRDVLA